MSSMGVLGIGATIDDRCPYNSFIIFKGKTSSI
ncbi:MAG: hypothetical protein K0S74_1740 [Chlamydiales bacterium]|jgi:hypothetical protein|nr:hypothetical protein [Chlamydiales bacterium]